MKIAAGGVGALLATVFAHYFDVVVGDAVAALIGFAAGYAICYRIAPGRSQRGFLAPVAGAVALFLGDRLLYESGMHGLPRKCGAVLLAVTAFAAVAHLNR